MFLDMQLKQISKHVITYSNEHTIDFHAQLLCFFISCWRNTVSSFANCRCLIRRTSTSSTTSGYKMAGTYLSSATDL